MRIGLANYPEKDVKESVKKLKKKLYINKGDELEFGNMSPHEAEEEIDKIFGDKLI